MCNVYGPAGPRSITERFDALPPSTSYRPGIGPNGSGPFLRRTSQGLQAIVGQWGMIAPRSKVAKSTAMTNNARIETVAERVTFRDAWKNGQRCLIPIEWYQEPNYEAGGPKSVAWQFRRADDGPFAVAGLWSEWTDPTTGEVLPNFTMCTMNCDQHPLLRRMHKPEPSLPPDAQDKRSVIPVLEQNWHTWLHGSIDQALALVKLPDESWYDAGPARPSLGQLF